MIAHLKKDWVLSQEAFDKLLVNLDRDPERAGARYEAIRRALITFFESRGSPTPEDHADDSINRVARRLLEGQAVLVESPARYFYGVARNVLKEYWDARGRRPIPIESRLPIALRAPDPQRVQEQAREGELRERRLDGLERCLDELDGKERELIVHYYQGETGVKIRNRRRLAARLGIPLNALRIRALRIREKLEECVDRRLGRAAEE